ncbi:hypothetical protein Q7P36_011071 [Cladosporium allicinum]
MQFAIIFAALFAGMAAANIHPIAQRWIDCQSGKVTKNCPPGESFPIFSTTKPFSTKTAKTTATKSA